MTQITPKELTDFLDLPPYQQLLNGACAKLGLTVNEKFPEVLYQYDLKKISCAGLHLSALLDAIKDHQPALTSFIILKYTEDSGDLDGEFPSNEKPGKADRAKIVKAMPVYRNFALGYVIEFTLLSTQPELIGPYLKCIRVPHAATYAKQLKEWYLRAQSSA